jgi:hypothetical protein
MPLSQKYQKILSPFVNSYDAAKNAKGRKQVLKNAAEALQKSKDLLEEKGEELPKYLETVCFSTLFSRFQMFKDFSIFLLILMDVGDCCLHKKMFEEDV